MSGAEMKKIINFRDYGGYSTLEGTRVKKGLLYRSGDTSQASSEDREALKALNIGYILDFRDLNESNNAPDPRVEGIINVHCPADMSGNDKIVKQKGKDDIKEMASQWSRAQLIQGYQAMVFNNPAYHKLFEIALRDESVAILHHCSAGKDRAGMGAMVMMLSLGVSKEDCITEYLKTQKNVREITKRILKDVPWYMRWLAKIKVHDVLIADRAYIQAALDAIESKYHSMDTYLETEYGLNKAKRAILKKKYCE